MYMPLCRDCHKRESHKSATTYLGDPSQMSVEIENKLQNTRKDMKAPQICTKTSTKTLNQINTPASSAVTATTTFCSHESQNSKSCSSSEDSLEHESELLLCKINS